MANQELNTQGTVQVPPEDGVHDNIQITQTRSWFKVNGVVSIFGRMERLNGKRPSFSLAPRPILSIHSDDMGGLYVQTDQALLFYKESELLSDEVIADEDASVVIDDITGTHTING